MLHLAMTSAIATTASWTSRMLWYVTTLDCHVLLRNCLDSSEKYVTMVCMSHQFQDEWLCCCNSVFHLQLSTVLHAQAEWLREAQGPNVQAAQQAVDWDSPVDSATSCRAAGSVRLSGIHHQVAPAPSQVCESDRLMSTGIASEAGDESDDEDLEGLGPDGWDDILAAWMTAAGLPNTFPEAATPVASACKRELPDAPSPMAAQSAMLGSTAEEAVPLPIASAPSLRRRRAAQALYLKPREPSAPGPSWLDSRSSDGG